MHRMLLQTLNTNTFSQQTVNSLSVQTDNYFLQSNNCVLPKLKGYTVKKQKTIQFNREPSTNKANILTKSKRTINNMKTKTFNNIISPYIREALQPLQSVSLCSPKLNIILRKDKTKKDLVTFFHGAMGSVVPSTWICAIKNDQFSSWSGLTADLVNKHLSLSIATAEGHQKKEFHGLQSTKTSAHSIKLEKEKREKEQAAIEDIFPPSDIPNLKTDQVVYAITSTTDESKAYSDLTGRFPFRSLRGNNYFLAAYHYDANAILSTALKNRQVKTIVDKWDTINEKLKLSANKPFVWIMDNECSKDLKNALTKEDVAWQLVPPHQHRANTAERSIQTFKAHFTSFLATADDAFPKHEYNRFIHQAELTLNLLRTSRANPKLAAYAYLFGEFNYNRTPLDPPGTKVVAHSKISTRTSWSKHGEQGWTIGPSPKHYRCIRCYFPKTRSKPNVDTVTFFPKRITFPEIDLDDYLRQAATDIITLLTAPPSTTTVTLEAGDPTRNALLKIATILNRSTPLPTINESQQTFTSESLSVIIQQKIDNTNVPIIPSSTRKNEYPTIPLPRVQEKKNTIAPPPRVQKETFITAQSSRVGKIL